MLFGLDSMRKEGAVMPHRVHLVTPKTHWRTEKALQKARFLGMSETALAMSDGQFLLLNVSVPSIGEVISERIGLCTMTDLSLARSVAKLCIQSAGMEEKYAEDFLLAEGEVAANAIRHAVGGAITFFRTETRLIFRVEDDGPGIPLNALAQRLFARFESGVGSIGLGLSLLLRLNGQTWFSTCPRGTVCQCAHFLSSAHEERHVRDYLEKRVAAYQS